MPEQQRAPPCMLSPIGLGNLATRSQITFSPLPEYEPPLEPALQPDLALPSSADLPNLPKPDSFQLALDLQWAREHRLEVPEVRIQPAEFQTTHWLLTAVVEVLDQRRPLTQVQHHVDTQVFAALETRLKTRAHTAHTIHLQSVHACQPVAGVIEACGVINYGQSVRALAARLEARKKRWLCTVLRFA